MPFFQIVYWVRGELEVVSDRTCSILEYLGHQSNQSNCCFLCRFFSLETPPPLCYPSRECGHGKSSHRVALMCYSVGSGSFPSHWVSNLDRYVWLSLFLCSTSFIGIPSTNTSREPVFTVYALFGQPSLCWFSKQNFLDILEISKLIAKLGLHNSFTCLESSYPVIRVTWPIVRWVGAWLHVLYISYYILI